MSDIQTPSQAIIADNPANTQVALVSANGKNVIVKPLSYLEKMKVSRAVGPKHAINGIYNFMVETMFMVVSVEGKAVTKPTNQDSIDDLVLFLGDDVLECVDAFRRGQTPVKSEHVENERIVLTSPLNKKITIRMFSYLDQMKVVRALGSYNVTNRVYSFMVESACMIVSVNGNYYAMPDSEEEIDGLVDLIGEDALECVDAWRRNQIMSTIDLLSATASAQRREVEIEIAKKDTITETPESI